MGERHLQSYRKHTDQDPAKFIFKVGESNYLLQTSITQQLVQTMQTQEPDLQTYQLMSKFIMKLSKVFIELFLASISFQNLYLRVATSKKPCEPSDPRL